MPARLTTSCNRRDTIYHMRGEIFREFLTFGWFVRNAHIPYEVKVPSHDAW